MANATGEDRREAAACVERGVERYAEGQYVAAQKELEAALALNPDHPRALECLAWVREIAAGRRSPSSDAYNAVIDVDGPRAPVARAVLTPVVSALAATAVPTTPLGSQTGRTMQGLQPMESLGPIGPYVPPKQEPRQASDPALRAIVPLPEPTPVPSSKSSPKLPGVTVPIAEGTPVEHTPIPSGDNTPIPGVLPRGQNDDAPDSVTREWSTISTGNLPQLDVPELSEEQIANLLDLDRGQGFTLTSGASAEEPSADSDDDDEIDRTNVRGADGPGLSGEYVVEIVAAAEDEGGDRVARAHDSKEPELTPLASTPPPAPPARASQTALPKQNAEDDASVPTNPFGHQHLITKAATASAESLEAALVKGEPREILELAEALGGHDGHDALLARAYEQLVGPVDAVPRYGKATPNLDSRSAFLLSRMDGAMSIDDLLDVSGMPRADALRVLARLIVAGVIVTAR